MATEGARSHEMPHASLLHIHVSLKGRTVRSFTFAHDEITIGRDPEADIFLDNVGVSREHARFERTEAGFVIEDLGSANGTYLNDKPVRRTLIGDDDVIQIGKYSLRVVEREDRRAGEMAAGPNPAAAEKTTVLSRDQVVKVLTASKSDEVEEPQVEREPAAPPSTLSRGPVFAVIVGAIVAGGLIGALVVFIAGR